MAIDTGAINLYIDIQRSEKQRRLIVKWETANKQVGGHLDLTDLFLSIRDFYGAGETTHTCTSVKCPHNRNLSYCQLHELWFERDDKCPMCLLEPRNHPLGKKMCIQCLVINDKDYGYVDKNECECDCHKHHHD